MRIASGGLAPLLASRQFFMADLYQFTLTDGTVLQYTSFDQDIAGYSSALGWERTQWKLAVGLSVDTMDITLHATPQILAPNGLPIIEHIASGAWDGADVIVSRGYMATPADAPETVLIFKGSIGDITEIGQIRCKMQVQSKLALLDTPTPKALFQPNCRWVFGSPSCGVDRAALVQIGTVGSGSASNIIQTGITTQPGPVAAPASPPTLSQTHSPVQGIPPNVTWYVKITYVNTLGETTASPESSLTISGVPVGFAGFFASGVLQVASPPGATNVTGWNVYVGVTSGGEQLQNFTAIPIGTAWAMPQTGPYWSGIGPPITSSSGFFSLGTITFTSGDNAGFSRVVESSTGSGTAILRTPLFSAVQTGDAFQIVPGCPHTMAACRNQFNNIANFGGFPFIPQPEIGGA